MDGSATVALAQRIADELLLPAAEEVETAGAVPVSHLDAFAAAGLYGLAGPQGIGLATPAADAARVVEALASGCLSTTFVWIQHHGAVRAVAAGPAELRERWLDPLCRGAIRAGVAIAGIRPGVEPLRSRRSGDAWVLDGSVPWVTGWGRVDVVHTATLDADGTVRWLLVDAVDAPTLRSRRERLVAVDASATVGLTFDEHPVPADRVTRVTSYEDWQASDATGLRSNGSLSLGVAGRCLRLMAAAGAGGGEALQAELAAARSALDSADAEAMPAARAAASELAWRCAGLLVTARGARSVLVGETAQRLAREAVFLLVFGSRASIKAELLARLNAR